MNTFLPALLAFAAVTATADAPPRAAGLPTPQDSLTAWMRPGVSLGLAEHRARTISDVRYELALDVSTLDHASGTVFVRFDRTGRDDVILDFRGPRLLNASANGMPLPGPIANGAHLRIADRWLQTGTNTLEFEFRAEIAPSGASIIRFHDRTDDSDYLYTLLVPADANQLFPCFDQPDLKARVTLTLTTPAGWSALANGRLASADTASVPSADVTNISVPRAVAGARITFHFAPTRPIST